MINQLAIKNTVSFITHSSKYIEIGGKLTTTWVESWFEKMLGRGGCHSHPQRPSFPGHVVLLQIKPSGSEHKNQGLWNDTFTIACVACDRRFRATAAWGSENSGKTRI